jgi:GNAT superfamily N-acetyltransferase
MSDARVRPALPDDPPLLAALQRSWWRDAYSELLPANVLDMDEAQLAEAWTLQLVGARGLIAEERTHPVGFALVDPRVGDDGIGRIDVLGVIPRWARRGHGGRLLVEAARILHDAGAELGALWAVEADESIAQFLAGAGWAPSGKRRVLDTGEGQLVEIQYSGTVDLSLDDEDGDDPHAGHHHPH